MSKYNLPLYQCHKKVEACRIKHVVFCEGSPSVCFLGPEDLDIPGIEVSMDWVKKHNPVPGGYFVVYADGYESFSPAEAFESGYTLLG